MSLVCTGWSYLSVFGSSKRTCQSRGSDPCCYGCSKRKRSQHSTDRRSHSALDGVPNGIRSRHPTTTKGRSKSGHKSKCTMDKKRKSRSVSSWHSGIFLYRMEYRLCWKLAKRATWTLFESCCSPIRRWICARLIHHWFQPTFHLQ